MNHLNRPWGTLVLTKGIAPCLFSTSTTMLSLWAGWSKLMSTPQEESWFLRWRGGEHMKDKKKTKTRYIYTYLEI